tara:strand:+ start:1851 stop:2666 length:816 start_codon:yes stop_codon:yes gene_type:complete
MLCRVDDEFIEDKKQFGEYLARSISTPECQVLYDKLTDIGKDTSYANKCNTIIKKLFNWGIKYGHIVNNPFTLVETVASPKRKVVWKQEQIKQFLRVAYSDFNTRNVGIIVHMAYEFAQRVGDMRTLEWDNIDFGNKVLNLTQSKRRAEVHIPISNDLMPVIEQQRKDFGWQKLVAPHIYNSMTVPYSIETFSRKARYIMNKAKLPGELRVSDLRRTATTEMAEAGVGMAQIMSVTGHSNPQSVKPYLKNTLTTASNACNLRSTHTGGLTI